jgi:heterodisulfide reductase subunit D
MEKAGVDVDVLPEEWCCGAPLLMLGLDKDFKEFAHRNTQAVRDGDYKILVCGCPDCMYMFKDMYSEMGTPLQAEVFHTSEFLLQLVKEGKIRLQESREEYVYHDPCILARKLHIWEEPRELLSYIPGLTLKEAHFNKEETKCCGIGGMLRMTSPEISFMITRERGSELRGISHSIVTACPACETAFRWMNDCDILDISELILKCM